MSGCGQEALPDVRVWSEGPPGCPGVVGRPSRMSGSGREALTVGRETFPNVWEWSGGPPGCPGVVRRPSRMSGSGRVTLPDVRSGQEDLLDVCECSGGVTGGWEVHTDVQEWSGGPHMWSGSLPDVQEWSGDPPACPEVVRRPYSMSGSGREAHAEVREWS